MITIKIISEILYITFYPDMSLKSYVRMLTAVSIQAGHTSSAQKSPLRREAMVSDNTDIEVWEKRGLQKKPRRRNLWDKRKLTHHGFLEARWVEVIICKHAFMIVSVFLMRKQARFTAQREKAGVWAYKRRVWERKQVKRVKDDCQTAKDSDW